MRKFHLFCSMVVLALPLAACTAAAPPAPPPAQQWLFGSAEGAIVLRQEWQQIAAYGERIAQARPAMSVVLDRSAHPAFLPCGNKPLAAVFDADETMIWNLGISRYFDEHGITYDAALLKDWEISGVGKTLPAPGAVEALARLRAAGITVIVNSNRSAENAAGTAATLASAGLGDYVHGKTLFLEGDGMGGAGKDERRAMIAAQYCVVLLAGDQLGDIADIFNAPALSVGARRSLAMSFDKWGQGWFVLANPTYGPSIRGDLDTIFPPQTRWTPGRP